MDLDAKKASSPSKGLLQSEELCDYILDTECLSTKPGASKGAKRSYCYPSKGTNGHRPDASQMIPMLLKLIGAKRMIEIGGLTRYYVLLTALSIPDDGKIIAVDMNRKAYDMGLPVVKKVGMKHKIDFMESKAFPVLDKLRKT